MKRQTNIRTSDATIQKLGRLTDRYGTQAEAVAVAVDRLFRQEGMVTRLDAMMSEWQRRVDELNGLCEQVNQGTINPDRETVISWAVEAQTLRSVLAQLNEKMAIARMEAYEAE